MARFNKKDLASVKKAVKAINAQEKEEQEKNTNQQTQHNKTLTRQKRKEIRALADNSTIKVTWNFNPGDLVIIKSNYSPTGTRVIGLVTWGQKEVQQRRPAYDAKSLSAYSGNIRVMSSAGYNFYSPRALDKL